MKKNSVLDIVQFVAALLVILVHCGRLVENEALHFLLKSFLGRLPVPLFLICNGYFYFQMDELGKTRWWKKQLNCYLFLSLCYLPLGLNYLQSLNLATWQYPLALLFGLVYSGSYYHLWYFPALFMGIWLIQKLHSKPKFALLMTSSLFVIGTAETYSALLSESLQRSYTIYQRLFFTSRNGLFYAPIFLLIGYFLTNPKIRQLALKIKTIGLLITALLFASELTLIFFNQGLDKNFFLSLPVFSFFLMSIILNNRRRFALKLPLRYFSQRVFFWHPYVLFGLSYFSKLAGLKLALIGGILSLTLIYLSYLLKNWSGTIVNQITPE